MKKKAFCIHGHFYQPPREDPMTGEIPLEPGAAPFKNWNEKIHSQCYKPNSQWGNFESISFNIGPTLIEWMVNYDPGTLARIVDQDRRNLERYGIGNAMAQPYNHTILPLANRNDKYTQVYWGIRNFEYYFGHRPTGMWLPETAVDLETLEILAELGMRYTILAPWQADSTNLDVKHPYLVNLPSGKTIAIFFYHAGLSSRISFDPKITENADTFIPQTLLPEFSPDNIPGDSSGDNPELILIASDGELYGHHQPFRDLFLSRLVRGAQVGYPIYDTFLSLWIQQHPPQQTIRIKENTSWSCMHGITRWCGECDCTPHAQWKAPLREAFNKIAKAIDDEYIRSTEDFFHDPWVLRHEYMDVIFHKQKIEDFVHKYSKCNLSSETIEKIRLLLAAQYERQRIFTSCGWFFDDFDRIEPRNNVMYAADAVRLTFEATGVDLSPLAMAELQKVSSWRTGLWASTLFNHYMQRTKKSRQTTPA